MGNKMKYHYNYEELKVYAFYVIGKYLDLTV